VQVIDVAQGLHVGLYDITGRSWSDLRLFVIGNRRAIVQVDYASLGAWRCQAGGDFGHAMTLAWWGRTTVMASDPLCNQARVYPESVIRHAAEKFARDTHADGVRAAVTGRIAR
jgi:hypothetical protein